MHRLESRTWPGKLCGAECILASPGKDQSTAYPLAVFDDSIRGIEPGETDPMVGFVMYQVMDWAGSIDGDIVDERKIYLKLDWDPR